MTTPETIDRIRSNLSETRRYTHSQPHYVRAAIDMALLDLLQLRAEITRDNAAKVPHWRDRLDSSPRPRCRTPVIKGTSITVGYITSLIVDGWTWNDIIRSNPELTELDIGAAVSWDLEKRETPKS